MSPRTGLGAAAGLALLLSAWPGAWAQGGAAAAPPSPPPPAAQQVPDSSQLQSQAAAADDKAADDKKKEEQKVILPNVNVQGQRNVFNDNDKKLKDLQESLPCTGCDAKPHTHRKLVKRVLDAVGDRVLPTEAPDHSDRDPNDKAQELSKENLCSASNMNGCVQDNLKP